MGLDIHYYESLTRLRDLDADGEYDWENGEVALIANHAFLLHADGMQDGIYRTVVTPGHFQAASYGGYNKWRAWLASVEPGRAFAPLVHFSDCDGFIGPRTSGILADAFEAHREHAREYASRAEVLGDFYFRLYEQFAHAFRVASRGGVVVFR